LDRTARPLWRQINTLRPAWPAIVGLLLLFQSIGALAEGASVVFIDGSAATLSPDRSGTISFDVAVKNSGTDKGKIELDFVGPGRTECGKITPAFHPEGDLLPNAIAVAHIVVRGASLPATCYLALTGDKERNTSLKQLKFAQHDITSEISYALYISLGLSAIVSIVTFMVARRLLEGVSARYELGSPAWDFAKSWISTTTLVGAVISTALTLSALPDLTRYASKSGYAALAMLISLVVIVAPFVFVAFRSGIVGKDPVTPGQETMFYRGRLWLFLASGAMTLFASLAQVVVLFSLLDEIFFQASNSHDRLPWSTSIVGPASAVALMGALCWHVGHSMFLTIKLQKEADKSADPNVAMAPGKVRERADRLPVQTKMPPRDWSVL
jgi:hypothetical protein